MGHVRAPWNWKGIPLWEVEGQEKNNLYLNACPLYQCFVLGVFEESFHEQDSRSNLIHLLLSLYLYLSVIIENQRSTLTIIKPSTLIVLKLAINDFIRLIPELVSCRCIREAPSIIAFFFTLHSVQCSPSLKSSWITASFAAVNNSVRHQRQLRLTQTAHSK